MEYQDRCYQLSGPLYVCRSPLIQVCIDQSSVSDQLIIGIDAVLSISWFWSLSHLVSVVLVVLPPQQPSFCLGQDKLFLIGRLVNPSHLRKQEVGDLPKKTGNDVTDS